MPKSEWRWKRGRSDNGWMEHSGIGRPMDLSIIIVNWNSAPELRRCLSSLHACQPAQDTEIIVIDNASYDGSAGLVASEWPTVSFIQSAVNGGFASGNNRAARHARGRYILFLNPDTVIDGHSVERLVRQLDRTESIGIVAPRLFDDEGDVPSGAVQAFPTLLNQALNIDWLRRRFPRMIPWARAAVMDAGSESVTVDVVCGACLMMSRDLFWQVGGFTEDSFMYSEDVDLCWKVRLAGKGVRVVTAARAIHSGAASSAHRSSYFEAVLQCDSRYRFFRRTRGRLYSFSYRVMMTTLGAVRLTLLGSAVPLAADRADLIRSLGKWARIISWGIGGQRWARQLNAVAAGAPPKVQVED